ncbi:MULTISPECIES: ABC transporter permease [unclassified Streptomyces]|uniref:ABC transporter permease n=1 Tax=unclassified Streptomyces TaxID=2593676 RepID=UPI0036E67A98
MTPPDDIAVATPASPTTEDRAMAAPREQSPADGARAILRRTLRTRGAQVGLLLTVLVMALAFLGPLFSSQDPTAVLSSPYAPPGGATPLGTDLLGRDVLSRLLHGGALILLLALVATVVGAGAGTLLGLVAGYRRGVRGELIMRSLDVVLSFPPLLLALLFMSLLGTSPWLVLITVSISHVPYVARIAESCTLAVTGRGFVQYCEMIGVSRRRILTGEILPSIVAPLAVQFGLRLTYSISLIASLAYLGFGRQDPAVDWGMMINQNQANVVGSPLPVLLPVLAITVVTVGANLLTDSFGRAVGIDLGREG